MPRMPMIEAAAKTLLLLSLLLAATMSSARSVPTTEAIEKDQTTIRPTTPEEYSTFSDILDMSTESDSVDANERGTTEKDQETFTSLPEFGLTSTEEPLPESEVQQLEDEQAEREDGERFPQTTTTTDNPYLPESLADTTTTKSPAITTTMQPITETTTIKEELLIEPLFSNEVDSIPNSRGSRMEEGITESQAEETTPTADVTESIQADQTSVKQEPASTTTEATASITESNLLQQTTWTPNLDEMAESTTEADAKTTLQPEPEQQQEALTEANERGTTENTDPLFMPSVTEMPRMEPEAQLIPTDVPTTQPELTTIVSATERATSINEGEATIEPPKAVVSLAATAETPATTEAAESTTDSAASTNIVSTTEPTVEPTTEQRPQATRAPRIERIFNPDGVEVLYGYSNVVRTNRA